MGLFEKQSSIFTHANEVTPCKSYSIKNYLKCIKSSLRKNIEDRATCLIYHLTEFFRGEDTNLTQCTTKQSAAEVILHRFGKIR